MDDFFPSSDYKIPSTSNYMKLLEGDNTFRVLSSAIVGYEYFSSENRPVRSKEPFDDVPHDLKKGGRISHFWAFAVWNYDQERVQILELTQKTIMTAMNALIRNPKWGNPKSYDITVTRKGTGLQDTEYTVVPNPHTPLAPMIEDKYKKLKLNLNALYTGDDPFKSPESNFMKDYPPDDTLN